MNEHEKDIFDKIPDDQMETVSGGKTTLSHILPKPITSNRGKYSSGETPKYSVGQRLKIQCEYRSRTTKVSCEVLSVSSTRNCGIFYKEFGYQIKILDPIGGSSPALNLLGKIFNDVYESCLYEN